MMIFDEIKSHLTGISCPIFGVSWAPPEISRKKANRIIRFLEDRRVLYNPLELEDPDLCILSIIEIRKFLTKEMQDISLKSKLYDYLKAMRIACRKFSNQYSSKDGRVLYSHNYNCISSWKFNSALGELRGSFGVMLAQIAVAYGIDIEDDLATILPGRNSKE